MLKVEYRNWHLSPCCKFWQIQTKWNFAKFYGIINSFSSGNLVRTNVKFDTEILWFLSLGPQYRKYFWKTPVIIKWVPRVLKFQMVWSSSRLASSFLEATQTYPLYEKLLSSLKEQQEQKLAAPPPPISVMIVSMDEGTVKKPIPNCRLYWCFCLGWCQVLNLVRNRVLTSCRIWYTTQLNTPPPPQPHTVCIYCTFTLGMG